MNVLWADYRQTLLRLQTDHEWLSHMRSIIPTMSTETYKTKQKAWDKLGDDELIRLIAEPHAEGVLKDPFSSRDFEYEKTPSGFILRCRIKPIDRDKPWEFEFKVHEKN